MLSPTTGKVWVDGLDVNTQAAKIRRRINMVTGGETSGYGLLSVREKLWMFTQFYGLDYRTTNQRSEELLEIVGLADRRNTKISDLSTGLRQEMNFVRGFITDPQIIFLDEPTLGLDVGAAREVRDYIKRWVTDSPEKNRAPHHPLYGRGRRTVRPSGDHRSGQDPGLRHPLQAETYPAE